MNEDTIRKLKETLPTGVKFLGAYLVVASTADHDYEVWYEIDNWAALDNWRKELETPNSKASKFSEEAAKELGAVFVWPRSKVLREAGKVKIFQPSKD